MNLKATLLAASLLASSACAMGANIAAPDNEDLGTVTVLLSPPTARVAIDGRPAFVDDQGMAVDTVAYGAHVVKASAPGYVSQCDTVYVSANAPDHTLMIMLEPRQTGLSQRELGRMKAKYAVAVKMRNGGRADEGDAIMKALAADGFAPAFAYAALACRDDDPEAFAQWAEMALEQESNLWIGLDLGRYYLSLGRKDDAVRCFELATESPLSYEEAFRELGDIRLLEGQEAGGTQPAIPARDDDDDLLQSLPRPDDDDDDLLQSLPRPDE